MPQEANEGEDELLQESITELMAGQFKHQFWGKFGKRRSSCKVWR